MHPIPFTFQKYLSLLLIVLLCQCSSSDETMLEAEESAQQTMLKVNGQIFCIPSPIEAALFLRADGEAYAPDLLLDLSKGHRRNAKEEKAMLLGAYGADLAYCAAFEDSEHMIKCLSTMRHLCEDLELNSAMEAADLADLESSFENKDSLALKIGRLFFKIDNYLKANQHDKLSSFMLTGGWTESMYLCADRYLSGKSKALETRMVEQRAAVSGLLNILEKEGEVSLKKELEKLAYAYQQIPIAYTYKPPITDTVSCVTELLGQDSADIQSAAINQLATTILHVRNFLFK